MSGAFQQEPDTRVERHHIDPVPEIDRRGRARDLFHVWFSANLNIGNAVFGLIIALICPNFWLAVAAILLGNVIGTALMSLHSIQGARLGIPQLIQSRGQFGYLGALVPVLAAALMYTGFTVSVTIVGGQALAAATNGRLNLKLAMLIIAALSLAIGLVGYRAIHVVARWATVPLAVSLVVVSVAAGVHGGGLPSGKGVSFVHFVTAVGIATSFALTYAPFVSDYSRYLPTRTSGPAIFWWTAAGVFTSAAWVCLLGAFLSLKFVAADTFQSARMALGGGALAVIVLAISAGGLVLTQVLNVYGGMLNLITGLSTFVRVGHSFRTRATMLMPTFIIGTVLAMFASADFAANLSAFVSLLLLVLIPWGALNLIDFYVVRRGHYDVAAMYRRDGAYWSNADSWTIGGFNLTALIAFVAGVLAGIPFATNAWYQGPLAQRIGGDISWLPGLVVTPIVYLILVRLASRSRETVTSAATTVAGV